MFCLKFDHYRKIAELEGLLAVEKAKVKDLTEQLVVFESERKDLTDWLLAMNGAPTLYNKPVVKEQPATPDRPFLNARTARQAQQIAQELENQAFRDAN